MKNRQCVGARDQVSRRSFLHAGAGAAAVWALRRLPVAQAARLPVLHERPARADRKFTSEAVEDAIARAKLQIADARIAKIFENCFPNTLDTTVFPGTMDGKPDTFVITGDIDAMWLRDSSAQIWPYLRFAKQDSRLAKLIEGVIARQSRSILIDPYANAFMRHPTDAPLPAAAHDQTDMRPGVGERKWEVDSLCYTIRLAHEYWRQTGEMGPFDATWHQAAARIVQTFREQQRKLGDGPYRFLRVTANPTDTLMLHGYGNPVRPAGMICSMFRPSDDACIYPFHVPANLFAVTSLEQLAEMTHRIAKDDALAQECHSLAAEVKTAIAQWASIDDARYGRIWAYEVDGYGNAVRMDDANAPGLLSLPYLGCCMRNDPQYRRTRAFALSEANPYFFRGKAAAGIGGPHIGLNYIWPMSILMRAMTSTDDAEIAQCLRWLRDTTAGTNFMHESFEKDDPARYTRPWFAWANTLFGEMVLQVLEREPALLRKVV